MSRIVVFDTETTGLDPKKFDIIQLAMIALDSQFNPDKSIQPFYMLIKPRHFRADAAYAVEISEAMNINKLSLQKIMEHGFDADKAAELFEEWWRLACKAEPIEPLCQNYPFDSGFMKEWLGIKGYNMMFSRYYRDTYVAARYLNDHAAMTNEDIPFKNGLGLKRLAEYFGIENIRAHDAYHDCLTTAEVWKSMCTYVSIPKGQAKKPPLSPA